MKYLFWLSLVWMVPAAAQFTAVPYDYYQDWRSEDQLYFSTFNAGEQWKPWRASRSEIEPLNLVDQINLCYRFDGGWNHYFNDCVIDDAGVMLDYLEAVEEAERFGFHYSAPLQPKRVEEDLSTLDPATLDWENYARWSPAKQLYFSALNY